MTEVDDFIDLVIRSKSKDILSNKALHSYYTSMAYDYWSFSGNNDNIDHFDMLLKTANSTKLVDTEKYLNLFLYIGSVACNYNIENVLESNDVIYLLNNIDRIILLTNHSGHFTFISYLNTHYRGFEIIGIPSTKSSYDNIEGCPIQFLEHDSSHLRYVLNNKYVSDWLKDIYYEIRDSDHEAKNLIIIVIWMYIHESGLKESFYAKKHPLFTRKYIDHLYDILGQEFTEYKNILLTDQNVNDTINVVSNYIKQYPKEYLELKKYQLKRIDINLDYTYFMLGMNYVYNYITK